MSIDDSEGADGATVHRNPAAGETMTVRSNGSILRAELQLAAAHHAPPAHVHPHAAERFTVTEGSIRVRIGRLRRTVHAGESVLVPAGVTHGYTGVPGTAARVLIELDPAGRMAEFFADLYGAPAHRRVARTGALRLRAGAALLSRYPDDIVLPVLPPALARPMLALVGSRT